MPRIGGSIFKKRALALGLIMLLALVTVLGCGGGKTEKAETAKEEAPAQTEETEKPAKTLKVALLTPGPINDRGWNATAYQGLQMIKEELGAEIAYSEKVAPSDFEEVFRGYASQGFDVIFGHGFQFGDPAMKVAKEFPNTKFIITSTDISQPPNVASLGNSNLEQGFVGGALCALLTKSKIVGSVGGMEIPSIIAYMDGFKAGCKYIDPNVKPLISYIGNFDDAAKGKELALAMIQEGADVINHDADHAGLGVIEAAKEKGVMAVGAISDQNEVAPEVVVNSALSDLSRAYVLIVKDILAGKFEAKCVNYGIKEGTVGLAPWHNWEDKVDQSIKDRMNQLIEDVKNGKLNIADYVEKK
ncbi:MAG TPA: BMP family ABC transporter substrate-binding protein [Clostridia bacterium]|nr:BMP family ABC transporter substrate-binding protein [Clostridia bacterium]